MSRRRPNSLRVVQPPRSPYQALEPTRPSPRQRPPRRVRQNRPFNKTLRTINGLFTFALVCLLLIGGFVVWVDTQLSAAGPLSKEVSFVVRRGEGARDIAKRLAAKGVISSQYLFVTHYVVRSMAQRFGGGKPLTLKAGDYVFKPRVSIGEVASALVQGKTVLFRISIPEGLTSYQIVQRLNKAPNLTGTISQVPAEGSLMPDTYRVPRNMDRNDVIGLMQKQMRKMISAAWSNRQENLPIKSPDEAIVLASIVEKETGRRDERALVAGVFVNRLRKKIRLQSDPTILYGLDGGKVKWGRPIYRSEIKKKTAHNTYAIDGLPPTPICNPGRAAILAVLNPAQTAALFFVADGRGGHIFSETLKQHNAAVAKWRRIERRLRREQKKRKLAANNGQGGEAAAKRDANGKPVVPPADAVSAAGGGIPIPMRRPGR